MSDNSADLIKKITDSIYNKINVITGVNTSCIIDVGSINAGEGCTMNATNKCISKSTEAIEGVVQGIIVAWQNMTIEEKKLLYPNLSPDATQKEVLDEVKNDVNISCQANATVTNSWKSGNISIKNCQGKTFNVKNTGVATADCALRFFLAKVITNSINQTTPTIEEETLPIQNNGLNQNTILSISSSIFILICIIILAILGFFGYTYYKK